jgi:adenine-specific DNA-methyltransferase
MNSLLEKEGMAGQVQMIYVDPPYGIRYGSNFQPFVNRRDVKDGKDEDLTQEPEMIRAFRDTWELGIHSYITYLRDRLFLTRDLLTDSSSVFMQNSDENVHHVRQLMDEVYGSEQFISLITFRKKEMALGAKHLNSVSDYLVWYAKNKEHVKYNELFLEKNPEGDNHWDRIELPDGTRRKLTADEIRNHKLLPRGSRLYQLHGLSPARGINKSGLFTVELNGASYPPPQGSSWNTTKEGMQKLKTAKRLEPYESGSTLRYVLFDNDYPVMPLTNLWDDLSSPANPIYVVQTNPKAIIRCLLMSTDPGDLVFDATCGSGTTAYVAEQWGRRWITCDTSRVAITLAKQRLMTSLFEYYELAHPHEGVSSGFKYKIAPHITLGAIANDEPPEQEVLYDQPFVDSSRAQLQVLLQSRRFRRRWSSHSSKSKPISLRMNPLRGPVRHCARLSGEMNC